MKKILVATAVAAAFGVSGVQAAEDITVDVAVIGAGGAGLSAAVEAANLGAKVVVVEKMGMPGGNTIRAAGGLNAAGTALQQAKGTKDSVEIAYFDTMKGGHWKNDPELVRTLVSGAAGSVEWLLALGGDLRDVGLMAGASQPRTHRPTGGALVGPEVVKTLYNAAKARQIDMRMNTQATKILMKDGKVTGIQVTNKKDGTYTIHAKAVVDAAGGFGANNDLVSKYVPRLKGFATTNHPGATGDGILLAEKIGAATVDMKQIQAHPTAAPNGTLISESVRGDGAILVNADGKRFTNELLTRDAVSAKELEQPGKFAWVVWDDATRQTAKLMDSYKKLGLTVEGNTVADLARAMNVPAANLEATMAQYAKDQVAGKDSQFGRPELLQPLTKAPFFAVKVQPAVHHTMGGLKIDTKAEVLNTEGKAIPGLFAAGEVTGGVHGGNRLGGNAQADIVTFGRIAGQSADAWLKSLK